MSTIRIPRISFVKYLELRDKSEYDFVLRYGELNASDIFNIGELTERPFGVVKDCQELLNHSGLTWEAFFDFMSPIIDTPPAGIAELDLFDLQCARLYLKAEVERVNELETVALGHQSNSLEEAAGMEGFAKFRSFIQFDTLAAGDVTKFEMIRKLPYLECFTKLALEKERFEFSERLKVIMRAKK